MIRSCQTHPIHFHASEYHQQKWGTRGNIHSRQTRPGYCPKSRGSRGSNGRTGHSGSDVRTHRQSDGKSGTVLPEGLISDTAVSARFLILFMIWQYIQITPMKRTVFMGVKITGKVCEYEYNLAGQWQWACLS